MKITYGSRTHHFEAVEVKTMLLQEGKTGVSIDWNSDAKCYNISYTISEEARVAPREYGYVSSAKDEWEEEIILHRSIHSDDPLPCFPRS